MVYSANIVTVAEMNFMAGAGIDTTNGSIDANHIVLQDYAEAFLSTLVKFDIATNFGTLNTVYKILFSEWAARYAGIALIKFNMLGEGETGFTRIEAEDRINIHVWRMTLIEGMLSKADKQDFQGT